MLLLNSDIVFIENSLLEIPLLKALRFKEELKNDMPLLLLSIDKTIKYRIISFRTIEKKKGHSKYTLQIQAQELEQGFLHPRIVKTLFAFENHRFMEERMFEKLVSFSKTLSLPPLIIHIKFKESQYIRFLFSDNDKRRFVECYSAWKDWAQVRTKLHEARKAFDLDCQQKREGSLEKDIRLIRDILSRFLTGIGFPAKAMADEKDRPLFIYWNDYADFIPFEVLWEKLLVQNLLPAPEHGSDEKQSQFTIIYSRGLSEASIEANQLFESLKSSFPLECYSDEYYEEYKAELNHTRFLHFAGHGDTDADKSWIIMNGEAKEELPYAVNLEMVLLNSCKSGATSKGIISSFFRNGTKFVIASPFSITDGISGIPSAIVKPFYEFFNPDDPEISFYLSCLKNPSLQKFYRFFRNFIDKI